MLVQVVSGGHRNGFIDFFPPAFVNSQIAQVNGPKFLERMVSGSNSLCSEVFVTSVFLLFQIEELENSKSFQSEIIKKQLHIISGKNLNNEQIRIRPLLTTCGMYVVKWESSVLDLRIWDNKLLIFISSENLRTMRKLIAYENFLDYSIF